MDEELELEQRKYFDAQGRQLVKPINIQHQSYQPYQNSNQQPSKYLLPDAIRKQLQIAEIEYKRDINQILINKARQISKNIKPSNINQVPFNLQSNFGEADVNQFKNQAAAAIGMMKNNLNPQKSDEAIIKTNLILLQTFMITNITCQLQCTQINVLKFNTIFNVIQNFRLIQTSQNIEEQKLHLNQLIKTLQNEFPRSFSFNEFIQKRQMTILMLKNLKQSENLLFNNMYQQPTLDINEFKSLQPPDFIPSEILSKMIQNNQKCFTFLKLIRQQIILIPNNLNQEMKSAFSVAIPEVSNKYLNDIDEVIKFGEIWRQKLKQKQNKIYFLSEGISTSFIEQLWTRTNNIIGLIRSGNVIQLDLMRSLYQPTQQTQIQSPIQLQQIYLRPQVPDIQDNNVKESFFSQTQIPQPAKQRIMYPSFNQIQQTLKNQIGKLPLIAEKIKQMMQKQGIQQTVQNQEINSETRFIGLNQQVKRNIIKKKTRRVYSNKLWDSIQSKNNIICSRTLKQIFKYCILFQKQGGLLYENYKINRFLNVNDLKDIQNQLQNFSELKEYINQNIQKFSNIEQLLNYSKQSFQKTSENLQNGLQFLKKSHEIHSQHILNIDIQLKKLAMKDLKKQVNNCVSDIINHKIQNITPDFDIIAQNIIQMNRQQTKGLSDCINIIHKQLQKLNGGISDFGPTFLNAIGASQIRMTQILKRSQKRSIAQIETNYNAMTAEIKTMFIIQKQQILKKQAAIGTLTLELKNQMSLNFQNIHKRLNEIGMQNTKIIQNQELQLKQIGRIYSQLVNGFEEGKITNKYSIQQMAYMKTKIDLIETSTQNIKQYLSKQQGDLFTKIKNIQAMIQVTAQQKLRDNNYLTGLLNQFATFVNANHKKQMMAINQLAQTIGVSANQLYQVNLRNKDTLLQAIDQNSNAIIKKITNYEQQIRSGVSLVQQQNKKQLNYFMVNLASWLQTMYATSKQQSDLTAMKSIEKINKNISQIGSQNVQKILNYAKTGNEQIMSGLISLYNNNNNNLNGIMNHLSIIQNSQIYSNQNLIDNMSVNVNQIKEFFQKKIEGMKSELNNEKELKLQIQKYKTEISKLEQLLLQIQRSLGISGKQKIKTQIEEKKKNLQQLKMYLKNIKEIFKITGDEQSLIVQLSKYRADYEIKQNSSNQLKSKIQVNDKQKMQLELKFKNLESMFQKAQFDNLQSKNQIEMTQSKLKLQKDSELQSIRKQLQNQKQQSKIFSSKNLSIESQYKKLNDELGSIKSKYGQIKQQKQNYQRRIRQGSLGEEKQLRRQKQQLESKISQSIFKSKQVESNFEKIERDKQQIERKLKQSVMNSSKIQMQLKNALQNQKASQLKFKNDAQLLEQKLKMKQSELRKLQEAQKQKELNMSSIKSKLDMVDQQNKKLISNLKQQIQGLQKQKSQLQSTQSQLKLDNMKLNTQKQIKQKMLTESQANQKKIQELTILKESQLRDSQNKSKIMAFQNDLFQQKRKSEGLLREQQVLKSRFGELQTQKERYKSQINTYNAEKKEFQKSKIMMDELKSKLQVITDTSKQLKQQLSKKSKMQVQLKQKLKKMQAQQQKILKQKEDFSLEVEKSKLNLEEIKSQLKKKTAQQDETIKKSSINILSKEQSLKKLNDQIQKKNKQIQLINLKDQKILKSIRQQLYITQQLNEQNIQLLIRSKKEKEKNQLENMRSKILALDQQLKTLKIKQKQKESLYQEQVKKSIYESEIKKSKLQLDVSNKEIQLKNLQNSMVTIKKDIQLKNEQNMKLLESAAVIETEKQEILKKKNEVQNELKKIAIENTELGSKNAEYLLKINRIQQQKKKNTTDIKRLNGQEQKLKLLNKQIVNFASRLNKIQYPNKTQIKTSDDGVNNVKIMIKTIETIEKDYIESKNLLAQKIKQEEQDEQDNQNNQDGQYKSKFQKLLQQQKQSREIIVFLCSVLIEVFEKILQLNQILYDEIKRWQKAQEVLAKQDLSVSNNKTKMEIVKSLLSYEKLFQKFLDEIQTQIKKKVLNFNKIKVQGAKVIDLIKKLKEKFEGK